MAKHKKTLKEMFLPMIGEAIKPGDEFTLEPIDWEAHGLDDKNKKEGEKPSKDVEDINKELEKAKFENESTEPKKGWGLEPEKPFDDAFEKRQKNTKDRGFNTEPEKPFDDAFKDEMHEDGCACGGCSNGHDVKPKAVSPLGPPEVVLVVMEPENPEDVGGKSFGAPGGPDFNNEALGTTGGPTAEGGMFIGEADDTVSMDLLQKLFLTDPGLKDQFDKAMKDFQERSSEPLDPSAFQDVSESTDDDPWNLFDNPEASNVGDEDYDELDLDPDSAYTAPLSPEEEKIVADFEAGVFTLDDVLRDIEGDEFGAEEDYDLYSNDMKPRPHMEGKEHACKECGCKDYEVCKTCPECKDKHLDEVGTGGMSSASGGGPLMAGKEPTK